MDPLLGQVDDKQNSVYSQCRANHSCGSLRPCSMAYQCKRSAFVVDKPSTGQAMLYGWKSGRQVDKRNKLAVVAAFALMMKHVLVFPVWLFWLRKIETPFWELKWPRK